MQPRIFLATGGAGAALALLPRGAAAAQPAGDAELNAVFQRVFEENVAESPEQASGLGLDKGANAALKSRLDERMPERRQANLARTRKAIAAVQAVGTAGLSATAKLNREVVLYTLTQRTVGPEKFAVGSPGRPMCCRSGYATPIERAGYLQSFLFRAARLVVDTGIDAKGWSNTRATRYFIDVVGFAQRRSQSGIERYCNGPGQACSYKLGHLGWLRARARAEQILGAKFDLKQFHEVLRDGPVPLTILERLT